MTDIQMVSFLTNYLTIKNNSKQTIHYFSNTLGERTIGHYKSLSAAQDYIFSHFESCSYQPVKDTYTVKKHRVSNIIAEIRGSTQPDNIIILGAHYDTVIGSPGANDNGSAVAGLLEIARLLSGTRPQKTIRLIAFTLEEPPYFATKSMGSMHYVKKCRQRNENVELMIALDMIGVASRRFRQHYPAYENTSRLPSRGTFLSVVSLPSAAPGVYFWEKAFNAASKRKIIPFIGPASIPGYSFSDHQSFVKYKYPAIMITDTGFYRSDHYHARHDVYKTINFSFLTRNIIDIYNTLITVIERGPLDLLKQ